MNEAIIKNPLIQEATTEKKSKIILPGQPSESAQLLDENGNPKFAQKEKIYVPPSMLENIKIKIPPIYYWEDVNTDGTSNMMTMAFKWRGQAWGMAMEIEDQNYVKVEMLRKKLFSYVKSTLDVLLHHGEKILDRYGNIDPRLVNNEEAIRYKYDKDWDKKVAAFNTLVRVCPITKKQAVKMKLVDKL